MRRGSVVTRGAVRPRLAAAAILLLAGAPAARGDDPARTPASPSPAPSASAMTPDERRDVLDRQLDASLSAFDAMLLKEQRAAAAKRAEEATSGGPGGSGGEGGEGEGSGSGTAGAGGSTGSGGDKGGQKGDGKGGARTASSRKGGRLGGAGSEEASADGDRSTGSARGGTRAGGGRTTASAPEGTPPTEDATVPPPADVGDGHDDDVVARQIREAAMKEEDPALREKLWEEYRRYKGIRAGGS